MCVFFFIKSNWGIIPFLFHALTSNRGSKTQIILSVFTCSAISASMVPELNASTILFTAIFSLCACVYMSACLRPWVCVSVCVSAHKAAVCSKAIRGVFFHRIASAALRPQGAANSCATSLLSLRHNWAAGDEDCSRCSLCSYCIMQLKSRRTFNLCSCCSKQKKSAFTLLRNHNDATTVICCRLSLFTLSAISSTSNSDSTVLTLFHTSTLKDL